MNAFLSEREHTARKRHRCNECSQLVEPGQRYSAQVSVDYGDFNIWKGHVECRAASKAYRELQDLNYDEESYGIGEDLDRREDAEWILAEHPIVAERLGINPRWQHENQCLV